MTVEAIDIHTHVVPFDFPPYLGSNPNVRWPSMVAVDSCHRNILFSGKKYRELDDASWSIPRRLETMDATGVSMQVLSPMPELLSYWLDEKDGIDLCRFLNGEIGAMVAQAPNRFLGLGTVPLQNPEIAAKELEVAMRSFGLKGVEIGTNVNGRPIGDSFFDPFFSAAEDLGAPIFVHAFHPAGKERIIGSPLLEAVVAYPCETAFAIASLISSGTLDRHPKLKLAFSHGGGAFALILPRFQHAWSIAPQLQKAILHAPTYYAEKLFYDNLVYDVRTLSFLLDSFGASQIMIGTDYPFAIAEKEPLLQLKKLSSISPEVFTLLAAKNAATFLGI